MWVHVKAGLRKKLRNKNPLSWYLSNRLCLPGDRDWHHFLLVSVYVYTQCPSVKKKKKKGHKVTCESVMDVCVRLSKVHVHFSSHVQPSFASAPMSLSGTWRYCVCWCAGLNLHALCVCACGGEFRKQTVGIYVESVPCAHAVSLIVHYAKGNMANWCHLVGLLGTRGLSMVPQHIGVVKINTVTLFGRKRHWTIYYCVYFSLSLSHLKGPCCIHREGGRTVETLAELSAAQYHVHAWTAKPLHNDKHHNQLSMPHNFILSS